MSDIRRNTRLLVAPPPQGVYNTTNSHPGFRRHPTLFKPGLQQILASGSDQVWVVDITHLPTDSKLIYLSPITQAYSRKIVDWHVHESLKTDAVAQAMKIALSGRQSWDGIP